MQEYNKTDRQVHWLSQVLAKTNRAFLPEKEDDSHTNLYFDPVSGKLTGRWVEHKQQKIFLALNVRSMHFEWMDQHLGIKDTISVFNKTMQEIEQDVSVYPQSIGLPAEKIFRELHFEIPDYKIGRIASNDINESGIQKWSYFRQLANEACLHFLGFLQAESEIRIWPHHFDTGVYAQVSPGFGIGFGLAMEDSMAGQSYFYLAGYASGTEIDYKNLAGLSDGQWITNGAWKGSVLTLDRLTGQNLKTDNQMIQSFIQEAANGYLHQKL